MFYSVATVPDAKKWRDLTDGDLRGYRAYTNHSISAGAGFARRVVPVTLLRHPLYRAASLYRYAQRKDGHVFQALANSVGLRNSIGAAPINTPAYFRNLQCRRVCGLPDAGLALDFVRDRYLGAGFTEHTGEFARALADALGWPAPDVPQMALDGDRYDAIITPEFREMVLSENGEDLVLFETVARGGLFSERWPETGAFGLLRKKTHDAALSLKHKLGRRVRRL